MTPDKKMMLDKSVLTKDNLIQNIELLTLEYEELEGRLKDYDSGKIVVGNAVYPGVKLSIGKLTYFLKDVLKAGVFYKNEGEIRYRK